MLDVCITPVHVPLLLFDDGLIVAELAVLLISFSAFLFVVVWFDYSPSHSFSDNLLYERILGGLHTHIYRSLLRDVQSHIKMKFAFSSPFVFVFKHGQI